MIYWKPFKSKYNLISGIIAELTFLIITLGMFSYMIVKNIYHRMIAWGMIALIVLSMIVSWICVVFIQIANRRLQARILEMRKLEKTKKLCQDIINNAEKLKENSEKINNNIKTESNINDPNSYENIAKMVDNSLFNENILKTESKLEYTPENIDNKSPVDTPKEDNKKEVKENEVEMSDLESPSDSKDFERIESQDPLTKQET